MDRDVVIGIAGAAILIVAMIGVFIYESGNAPNPTTEFPVTWPVAEGPAVGNEDTLQQGANEPFDTDLIASNVTVVRVTLTWSDDVGEPDTFSLGVTAPAGIEPQPVQESDSGTITFEFAIATPPTVATLPGATPAEAAAAAQAYASTAGMGAWNYVVTLVDAPGVRPAPPPLPELEPDGANSFEVAFSYSAYRAQLGEPVAPA